MVWGWVKANFCYLTWILLYLRAYCCELKCKNLNQNLPNSPGNSCWASSTNLSVHHRSCDEAADPSGEVVPDAECCESSAALLLFCVIFEFQSDCGEEPGKWWYTAVGPVGRCICNRFFGAILTNFKLFNYRNYR